MRLQVDRLANPIRAALVNNPDELAKWDQAFRSLKRRIAQRVSSVAQQLGEPPTPLKFGTNSVVTLQNWEFKGGPTESATGSRIAAKDHELGRITGSTDKSSGSWRTTLFLEAGYYELVGLGRTENAVADLPGNVTGLRLRISGDRSPTGSPVGDAWKRLSYEFEIQGNEAVELVAEYRGKGVGVFDLGTLQLRRKGP